jgi:hypothetical protein
VSCLTWPGVLRTTVGVLPAIDLVRDGTSGGCPVSCGPCTSTRNNIYLQYVDFTLSVTFAAAELVQCILLSPAE